MSVSGISSTSSSYDQYNSQRLSPQEMEKQFESLGSALESGDMTTAKSILTTIQQNTPCGAKSGGNDQMGSDMQGLSSAISAGDQQSALAAYNNIKSKVSQMKQSAEQPGMPSGQGQGGQGRGQGGAVSGSSNSSSSSGVSNKYYDKMDANKDGKVTYDEETKYRLNHPNDADKNNDKNSKTTRTQTADINQSVGTIIDTIA
jgi:hypothetical protein